MNRDIDRLAAEWATKRDLHGLSSQEEAEFEAWLQADKRHLGAYGRAEAVLARLDRLNPSVQAAIPDKSEEQVNHLPRRALLAGGLATSLAAVAGLTILYRGDVEQVQSHSTEIGQNKELILADGSIVLLNTHTQISVFYTRAERKIELLQGEALFNVAKNKDRPFVVKAGDTHVQAIGTSFAVSMLPKRPIEVLVREGVVELQRSSNVAASPVRVGANIRAIAAANVPIVTFAVPEEKLAQNLSWQNGRIALDDQTLEQAADEFARYSEVRIVVDPAIATRTVTGLFASNDPVGFAKVAADVLKLRVEVRGNEVRIF